MTQVEQQLPDMTTADLLQAFAANEAALLKNAVLLEREFVQSKPVTSEEEQDDDEAEEEDEHTIPTSSPFLYLELRDEAERIRHDLQETLLTTEAARELLADDVPPAHKKAMIEVRGQRTRVPRTGGRTTLIKEHIQRNLNVQWADTVRYCVLFLFFGYFGGRTPVSRAILLLGAPSVFVLQARPVKLLLKQALYTLLDHPPGILLSLLPAPQQAILNLDYAKELELLYKDYMAEEIPRSLTDKVQEEEEEDSDNDDDDDDESDDSDDFDSDDDDDSDDDY